MTTPSLFAADFNVPEPTPGPKEVPPAGPPRLRPLERHQVELRCASLDQLLPPDHQARLVWAYVAGLDLTALLQQVKAVAGRAGRDANDPRVLLALWLFATID